MRVAAVVLVALVSSVPAAATNRSGLRGLVMQGPTAPVCRADDACEKPARGLRMQFRRDGRVVAEVTTTGTGTYTARLKPGSYTVTVPGRRVGRGLTPRTVLVPRGRVAHVDFHLDTGIQ